MSDDLYKMYCDARKFIITYDKELKDEVRLTLFELLQSHQVTVDVMERCHPEYKDIFDTFIENQRSFTHAQMDFIGHQIDDWYLDWRKAIVGGVDDSRYQLDVAKEQLKTMIYGE